MANDTNARSGNENDEKKNKGGNARAGRGFASMDEDQQREIASKGGKAAHEKGTAHEFDSETAREAGRRGGEARQGTQNTSNTENIENEP